MRRRAGFTLTELLIVIAILLVLGTISLAVYNTGKSSDRLRSASRIAQSALLGAKDRAMHARNFRGVRLTRDANGPTFSATNTFPALVTGFVFLQPIAHDPYPTGSISLERYDNDQDTNADGPDVYIVHGVSTGFTNAVDWNRVYGFFGSVGRIRIPAGTGQWYNFTVTQSGPYAISATTQYLILSTPYVSTAGAYASPSVTAYPFVQGGTGPPPVAGCEIEFGNEVLPFHQPMALPAGVVIDLRYCSSNVQYMAGRNIIDTTGYTAPNIDFSFSPRGNVAGATGGLGALYFCLRDIYDATAGLDPSDPTCKGECLILALNPATGLVQTYDANLNDLYNNSTGNSGADGYVDDLFTFAKQGKAAGR